MRDPAECPNLRELYGDRFRIGHDPLAATPSQRKDPWMMTILCRGGAVIYPHGRGVLAGEVDYRPHLAKRLAAIPGVRLHQCGNGERSLLFPVNLFDQVAELVKPRRRRRLTQEQRAANVGRLAAWRENALAQSRISTLESTISAADGPQRPSSAEKPKGGHDNAVLLAKGGKAGIGPR